MCSSGKCAVRWPLVPEVLGSTLTTSILFFFSEKFNLPKPKFKNEEPLIRIIEGNKISKLTPFNYSVNNLLI